MTDLILKPCPLCGGEAKKQESYSYRYTRIFCVKCGLSTMDKPAGEITALVEHWNKRKEVEL